MPIFHDHYDSPPREPTSNAQHERQPPEHYSGYGYAGGLQEGWYNKGMGDCTSRSNMDVSNMHGPKSPSLNRVELIERIKRSNSPSWLPRQNNGTHESPTGSSPTRQNRPPTPLLPAAELKRTRTATPDPLRDNASAGIEIERPRSALHSGDFREEKSNSNHGHGQAHAPLSTSPIAPWHQSFPGAALRSEPRFSLQDSLPRHEPRTTARARATSQSSFSSSFVFLPPTSPLVQQSNNTDLDFSSRPASRQSSRSPERSNRRHTFSPHSFQTFRSSAMERSASGTPAARHLRREGTYPYQAHQPRRSLTSLNPLQPRSNPQTPVVQPRRPSISSESPLQHAPMVGSYEESILRGRMSTTPSRPLNFVAQVGVLGKGNCKPALRCPKHVTVPFPAVFYSYSSGNGRIADNTPSPYVGFVDLENSLSPPEDSVESSRRKRRHTVPNPEIEGSEYRASPKDDQSEARPIRDLRKREKMKRRSTSPKAPPGGSYRIPQQGQLQIVLKNPNKTAVKLFLVPYDLSDMEPGQKTFIRQRSYSAGPIIDMPLSSRKNFGTDRPEAALSNSDDPNDRPVLRYLIHLHLCCPSKGRYFLYKGIRVVFANRVPDGKEKLRNEIQLPEPRYSAYKPGRESLAQHSSSAAAQLTAEKAFRRRSAGLSLSHHEYDRVDGLSPAPPVPEPVFQFAGNGNSMYGYSTPTPVEPIPFSLTRLAAIESRPVSRDPMSIDGDSPFRPHMNGALNASPSSSGLASPVGNAKETYDKLRKGDVGYGGNAFCGVGGPTVFPGAGLLALHLKGLDVKKEAGEEEEL